MITFIWGSWHTHKMYKCAHTHTNHVSFCHQINLVFTVVEAGKANIKALQLLVFGEDPVCVVKMIP